MNLLSRISSAWRTLTAPEIPSSRAGEFRSIESPNVAINPVQLDGILNGVPTRSGILLNEKTAMTVVAVYVAHKVLGETLGMLNWAVYEGDEDEKDRRRAKDHPAYSLLRHAPNDEMTAFSFKETLMHHCAGWGNGFARIWFNNRGDPKSMSPMLPQNTHVERKGGQLMYTYERRDGTDKLWPEEVLHIPGLSFDGLKGYSPITLAREALGVGKAAEIFAASFYGNGCKVGGFLKHPNKLKPEARANLQESFTAKHGGSGNAHKLGILEEGMEYVKTSIPPDEAQFLETRKFSVMDVARLYRIPPHMLGEGGHVARASLEQASLEFLIYTIAPWLTKFEQEADRKLCGRDSNHYVKFDERQLLRTDLSGRQEYYAAGRMWGFLSANDVRRMEGEDPIGPQGDVYLSPANEQNAKVVLKMTAPPDPAPPSPQQAGKPGGGGSPFGGDPKTQRAVASAAMRVVFEDAIGRMLRKEANALTRIRGDAEKSDKFYAEHRQHVRESLSAAVQSLNWMIGESGETHPAVEDLAEERHTDLNGNIPALAAAKAGELISKITETP